MNVEDTREAIKAAKRAFKEWANLTAKVSYYHPKYVYSAAQDSREAKKKLEIINADSYLSNLLANMGNMLLKKNKKNYDCGKTIIWVNLLAYCHVDIEDLTMGKNFCLAYKSREIDEKFFSHFLLKKIKEISKEFRDKGKKMNFDYLIIKFAEADQETMHEGKLYKFVFFVKEILNIPIVSGEIMVEEELKKIDEEYKGRLDKLRISSCKFVPNWETRKLLMNDDEKKYHEKSREKQTFNLIQKS